MRVLVCGGRNYNDELWLFGVLNDFHKFYEITTIIHGCASGADTLAGKWANENGIPEERYPAQWEVHGKKAGILRNIEMIKAKPDYVIAFPGGRGTEHMVNLAIHNRISVLKC